MSSNWLEALSGLPIGVRPPSVCAGVEANRSRARTRRSGRERTDGRTGGRARRNLFHTCTLATHAHGGDQLVCVRSRQTDVIEPRKIT